MTTQVPEPYTVGIAQVNVKLGDLEANLAKHLDYIEKAHEAGISLLIFPELSLTGYYLQDITNQIGMSVSSPPDLSEDHWTPREVRHGHLPGLHRRETTAMSTT